MTTAPARAPVSTGSPPMRRPTGPPLPPKVGHYLRQVLAGRFRLVAAETTPPPLKGRALVFERGHLQRIPESPTFQDTLARLDPGISKVGGWLQAASHGAPVLFLDGLGAWTLRLPKHGKSFQSLRELRTPDDLRPSRSYEDPGPNGPARRRHLIPLRYHPDAFLVIAVIRYPSGHVRFEAWIWHAARKTTIPLYWEEAQRCIDLFRDLVASWFRVHPAPAAAAGGMQPEVREVDSEPAGHRMPAGSTNDRAAV